MKTALQPVVIGILLCLWPSGTRADEPSQDGRGRPSETAFRLQHHFRIEIEVPGIGAREFEWREEWGLGPATEDHGLVRTSVRVKRIGLVIPGGKKAKELRLNFDFDRPDTDPQSAAEGWAQALCEVAERTLGDYHLVIDDQNRVKQFSRVESGERRLPKKEADHALEFCQARIRFFLLLSDRDSDPEESSDLPIKVEVPGHGFIEIQPTVRSTEAADQKSIRWKGLARGSFGQGSEVPKPIGMQFEKSPVKGRILFEDGFPFPLRSALEITGKMAVRGLPGLFPGEKTRFKMRFDLMTRNAGRKSED